MLDYKQVFNEYIRDLQMHSLTEVTEHSHRLTLQNLLNRVKICCSEEINILHEPKRQGKNGSPDFMVSSTAGIIGYIENKKITQGLHEIIDSEQILKYKKLSNNLLITNYIDFYWLKGNEILCEQLCTIQNLQNKSFKLNPEQIDRVFNLVKRFFNQSPRGVSDVETLAEVLAERAKYLFVILNDYLIEQEQNAELQDEIWGTYQTFVQTVYDELTIEDFTDTFAQTLTYGLFLAKLNQNSPEQITLRNIDLQIPNHFPLIKNIVGLLKYISKEKYSKAVWIVEEILSIINNLDLRSIQESLSFSRNQKKNDEDYKDPYVYFYEHFLAAYNPALRKSRGVYYTPNSVVRFIIKAIDDILQDKNLFDLKNGIADYEHVNFLDFATGTGTFLLEILEQLNDKKPFNKPEGNNLIKKHIQNLYGFEFLIAPYVISHVKLTQYLKEKGFESQERLPIYLTNTLEDKEPLRSFFVPELSVEGKLAQKIKRTEKILVITGNPPYSGHSSNASSYLQNVIETSKSGKIKRVQKKQDTWIGRLIKDYYKIEEVFIDEKNTKWLQDDYVKFIRFAQHKIEQTGEGLVAIITNHAFLDNPTFRAMRYSLLKTFDQMFILDLHGNLRKKEKTPTGDKDENVFDIQQGVCITFLIKKKGLKKEIKKADLWGLRKHKNKQLFETSFHELEWTQLRPSAPFYLFSEQNEELKKNYESWYSVNEIFKVTSIGIVTARDKLCIQYTKEKIREVVHDFVRLPIEQAREKYELGDDARDWSIEMAQNDLKKSNLKDENFKKIHYRPFDIRYTYYTGNSRGFQCMPRRTVMDNFKENNFALVCSRFIKSNAFAHAFVTNQLSNGAILATNTASSSYVFPLYLYIEKGLLANPEEAKRKFKEIEKDFLLLQKEYQTLLKNKSEHWSRLGELAQEEYHASIEEYETLVDIKQNEYEKAKVDAENNFEKIENLNPKFRKWINEKYHFEYKPEQILAYIYAILFSPAYREKYKDFLKSDFPKIPFCESKEVFEKVSFLGHELIQAHLMIEIPTNTVAELYDGEVGKDTIEKVEFQEISNIGRLYINKTNYFESISKEVFEFQIGGYQVIDKYLKERKGFVLHIEDIQHIKNVVKILAFTLEKMQEIDQFVTEFIKNNEN